MILTLPEGCERVSKCAKKWDLYYTVGVGSECGPDRVKEAK